jgi:hypothetical protein
MQTLAAICYNLLGDGEVVSCYRRRGGVGGEDYWTIVWTMLIVIGTARMRWLRVSRPRGVVVYFRLSG